MPLGVCKLKNVTVLIYYCLWWHFKYYLFFMFELACPMLCSPNSSFMALINRRIINIIWNCFHHLVKNLILVNTLPLQYKCDILGTRRKQQQQQINTFNALRLKKKRKKYFLHFSSNQEMHTWFIILVYSKNYLLPSWTRGCRRPTTGISISLSFRHYSFTPLCWYFLHFPFQMIQAHLHGILLTVLFIRQWKMFQFLINYYEL